MTQLTIAIAKGRLQAETLDLLSLAGLGLSSETISTSRRLAVEDESGRYRLIFVKPADVPVYVEHGIADCGIVGRDVLLESEPDLLQPLSLNIGACRIVVAASENPQVNQPGILRVATKYPRIAARHFGSRGIAVELIQLSGSVELASVLGLADCIVDLVETGNTLRENGLKIIEVITDSTARLVVNRASYQLKAGAVGRLVQSLEQTRGAIWSAPA
jgi:ATP phosphoribosyltransferase